jgi:hypothetical protein
MVYQLRGTWRSCEAHQFQLPQFAQRNLDAVKAELPGAQFSVEEFKVGVAPVDPILYVFYKGQGFGIAVWGTRGKEVVI